MSFILDALRKSETERQRQSGPGLADAGYRPPVQRRNVWLPVLVIVLIANLVLLGTFWLRRPDVAVAEGNPAPASVTASRPGASETGPPTPVIQERTGPSGAGAAAALDDDYAATADLPALDAQPSTLAAEAKVSGGQVPVVDESPPSQTPLPVIQDDLPTAQQLMANGTLPTQPMHLDIHVFSSVPAERFVFINMRRYTEGSRLADGAQVEEITREGVVLSQNGQRFVLTRE